MNLSSAGRAVREAVRKTPSLLKRLVQATPSLLKQLIPPVPWTGQVASYERELLRRFSAGAFDVKAAANGAAKSARDLARSLEASASGLEPSDPSRTELDERVRVLRSAATDAETIVTTWDTKNRPAEDASAFVQRSLDLQVSKAAGLLTYNGVATAVALILWTNRSLPPTCSWLSKALFIALLGSSLISLVAVFSLWAPAATYANPQLELTSSLNLIAARAWAANIATALAIVATVMIALWTSGVCPQPPIVNTGGSSGAAAGAPLPITLSDTLKLHCQEQERPRAVRGQPAGDTMNCTLSR